jgi:hypothetical protein
MEFESFLSASNEVVKAIGTTTQFIKELKLDPAACMQLNSEGNQVFSIMYAIQGGGEYPVKICVKQTKLKSEQDRILVWADVTSVENISALNSEGFFRALLKLNALSDTAWAGITEEKNISVKSERMARGMDVDELASMVKMTARLASEIYNHLCVIHGIKTLPLGPGAVKTPAKTDDGDKAHSGVYWDVLNTVHAKVNETIDSCRPFLPAKEYLQCNKLYFKALYEMLDMIKARGAGSNMLGGIREELERAISDLTYLQSEQSKYTMFKELFEKILKVRG